MKFKNKVVVITGAGSGIGRALASAFCREGAKVALNGRDAAKLEDVRLALQAQGYEAMVCAADVGNADESRRLAASVIAAYGGIDILIANAGVAMRARFDELSAEHFKSVFDGNFYTAVMPLYAMTPSLKASKGSVVFIGSVAGFYGLPTASAYSAAKMALTALAQSLRAELKPQGVHVGIAYVGFTRNDPDKRAVGPDGSLNPVADRMKSLQQTQEQAAQAVLQLTARRRFRRTFSLLGKLTEWVSRLTPGIIALAADWTQKRNK